MGESVLKCEFLKCEGGIIDYQFVCDGVTYLMEFWNTWDDLDWYIKWLEDVSQGKNVSYSHDPEKTAYYFDYEDGVFWVHWGCLTGDMEDDTKNTIFKVSIKRETLCKELYSSFRKFVTSKDYNPLQWESYTLRDLLRDIFQSDDFMSLLKTTDWESFKHLFWKSPVYHQFESYAESQQWNFATCLKEEMTLIHDYILSKPDSERRLTDILDERITFEEGIKLHLLKSEILEAFSEV